MDSRSKMSSKSPRSASTPSQSASDILDKPTESVFGYISVLPGQSLCLGADHADRKPGAFSAYRYVALQNDPKGHGPLTEYFKGETLHTHPDTDLWTKNMSARWFLPCAG
jgi:chitin synthase